jgi:hypothetical protein
VSTSKERLFSTHGGLKRGRRLTGVAEGKGQMSSSASRRLKYAFELMARSASFETKAFHIPGWWQPIFVCSKNSGSDLEKVN